jgi:hypothetical protein
VGNLPKIISKTVVGILIIGTCAFGGGSYSFIVENSTKTTITEILVSEDGRQWGHFDIGKGIKPHKSMKLIWDESTNDEDCKQYVKAVWSDGSESESAIFDFCQKNLEIVF